MPLDVLILMVPVQKFENWRRPYKIQYSYSFHTKISHHSIGHISPPLSVFFSHKYRKRATVGINSQRQH